MTMRFLVLALAAISSPMMVKATAATAAAAAAAATKTHSGKRNGSLNANNNNNNNNKPINIPNNNADLSAALLEKAVRLSSNLGLHDVQLDVHVPELQLGVPLQLEPEFMNVNTDSNQRFLEDGGDEGDNNEDEGASGDENDDDYYMNQLYSFSGFSLKYAKCQTIQRFSEDAIKNGEYSAMVKDDIVILRLCPTSQCNSNKQYGCHYNYAEYAIGVSDYVKIMLKYTIDKRSKMCDFCATCSGGRKRDRKLEEEGDNEENEEDGQSEQGDEDQQFDDDNYYKVDDDGAGDNNAANGDDNAAAAANDDYVDPCDTYADDCDAAYNYCNGGADDDVGYLDYVDYLDYLDCVKVQGQEGQDSYYWIRPRCDATKGTIHMDIYYDPYCSQYAGGDVNLREFSGIYFRTSVFEPFYSGTCVDCSENENGPYYNANSNMCNRLYTSTAQCSKNLMYKMFDDDGGDSSSSSTTTTECSFIESIRKGTYNEKGEIYVDSSIYYGEKVNIEVTARQQAGLIISIFICVGLGIYSCYLHHSITNLLIKSLSHSHLLPPSRHRARGRRGGSNGRSSSGRRGTANRDEDDDWDRAVGVQA